MRDGLHVRAKDQRIPRAQVTFRRGGCTPLDSALARKRDYFAGTVASFSFSKIGVSEAVHFA